MSKIAQVKKINREKGFGFLTNISGKDIYFNLTDFKGDINILEVGIPISYKIFFDQKIKKTSAVNCTVLKSYEDFKNVMSIPEIERTKLLVEPKKNDDKYSKNKYVQYQIKKYCFRHLFANISSDDFKKYIYKYYNDNIDSKNYIEYAYFIYTRVLAIQPQSEARKVFISELFKQFQTIVVEEVTFDIWRNNNYRLLGFEDHKELNVTEETIIKFKEKFTLKNLKTLSEKQNTERLRYEIIQKYFDVSEEKDTAYFIEIKKNLEFLSSEHNNLLLPKIEQKLLENVILKIRNEAGNYGVISSEYQINWFTKLRELIPEDLSAESKAYAAESINDLLHESMTSNLKITLFVEDKVPSVNSVSTEELAAYLKSNYGDIKAKLLSKISSPDRQFEVLIEYAKKTKIIDAFSLLKDMFLNENDTVDYNEFLYSKFNFEWLNNYKHAELMTRFLSQLENEKDQEVRKYYFFNGLIKVLSEFQINPNILEFSSEQFSFIFDNPYYDSKYKQEIASIRIAEKFKSSNELEKFLKKCKEYFDSTFYSHLYQNLQAHIDLYADYNLWRSNLSISFPYNFLTNELNDSELFYEITFKNIAEYKLSTVDFSNCLLNYLELNEIITNRKVFLKQYFHVKYLLLSSKELIENRVFTENKSYELIAWFFDEVEHFDFENLKKDFIYFPPADQRILLRKIFYYIKTKRLNIGIKEINEIARIDAEIFKDNQILNPDVELDFTVDLVIKSLLNFTEKNKFFVHNELLELLLSKIYNAEVKFSISDFFEDCRGMQIGDYKINEKTDRIIRLSTREQNDEVYIVSFGYNVNIVDSIRNIPGRKWNKDVLKWEIPITSKDALIDFATKFYFVIYGPTSDIYADNKHLVKFRRTEIPFGVKFCEGRKSKVVDRRFGKDFWWCRNQICFQNCETKHEDNWRKYNFLDFCLILGLDLTEVNKMNDIIPNGYYYHFTSLLNRFKLLIEKLNCNSCNHILQPLATGHFGAYTVTKFHCTNNSCSNGHEVVYLNHCLNGQCNNVIDSRMSKKCSHGLFICDVCGSCCSHTMFSRRLTNLQTNNGFIHQELIVNINKKLGHLERAEYFCYKCGEEMKETTLDVFRCSTCNVSYDTKKYRFKREHRMLKK